MENDKEEKSSMVFWRCGIGFEIEVSHDDVRGTSFSKKWLEHLKEPISFEPPLRPNQWVRRWECLCDCILTQCMPILGELAPSSTGWVTLDDYLHTPSYTLRMVTSAATKDAVPEIIEGPKDMPSYEHWPTAAANVELLPMDGPRLHAKDLIALDQGNDWRRPPEKVQAPDGRVLCFKACEKTAINVNGDTETMANNSIDTINVYSRLYKKAPENVHIPRMEGIVVTEPSIDIKDSSPSAYWSKDPPAKHQNQRRHDETLVAGILLVCVNNSKTLAEHLKPGSHTPIADQKENWKKQIVKAVDFLDGQHITIGGRGGENAWHYINQHTVIIAANGSDTEDDAWLTLEAGCTLHEPGRLGGSSDAQTKFDVERAMDLEGVEKTFDF
jgi:hypothetical protein